VKKMSTSAQATFFDFTIIYWSFETHFFKGCGRGRQVGF
jgi:hypothetical protein